ncbi:hypothetical protein ANN_21601 [Periplaneta americana]|uniref:Uncharacterized protein n=1 Tax=Periplaneta americana TaxID=6978 RepID=A0ABQ8S5W7_PERAM|nr:hypothetical protein ANN_21601 [Periplaneta americana]
MSAVLRWAGHVALMGESRNAFRVLVGRPEGKRPLGRPRCRWEDNIKMDLREVGYDDRDWINLAQDRDRWRAYVRAAMNLRVPLPRRPSEKTNDDRCWLCSHFATSDDAASPSSFHNKCLAPRRTYSQKHFTLPIACLAGRRLGVPPASGVEAAALHFKDSRNKATVVVVMVIIFYLMMLPNAERARKETKFTKFEVDDDQTRIDVDK